MDAQALVVLGRIRTVFGVKGWLKVQSFTNDPDILFSGDNWLLSSEPLSGSSSTRASAGKANVVEVDEWKVSGSDLLVHFKGLDNREEAARYRQQFIHLPGDKLPELAEDEIYWHQLEGMDVYNLADANSEAANACDYSGAKLIGKIDHLLETGANDVIVVSPVIDEQSSSTEKVEKLMVPYVLDYSVIDVDVENRRVLVDWVFE